MLTTFGYTVLAFLREKWLLLWALAFPVILSTLFAVMFAGIVEMQAFDAPRVAVVVDENYYAAPGFAQTMEAVSNGTLPGSRRGGVQGSGGLLAAQAASSPAPEVEAAATDDADDQAVLVGIPVATAAEALALVAEGDAKGYIAVDAEGLPGFYYAPGTTDEVDSSVVKAVLDSYVHGVAEIELVAQERPLAALNPATYQAFIGQDAVGTEQVSVTRSDPHPTVRYYYALLGMAAGMAAQISAVAVGRLRADSSAVGGRRVVSGTSPWKLLVAVLAASWLCAFACLAAAYAYMRFVLGIDFGDRDALCLAALAVASFMACAAGGAVGACVKEATGLITGLTCFLSLFAGLYGEAAMRLADAVAQVAPWFSAVNPVWQCARAFYDLLYYDSLEPFAQTCAVLAGMGLVFLAVAVLRMRRRYEHL